MSNSPSTYHLINVYVKCGQQLTLWPWSPLVGKSHLYSMSNNVTECSVIHVLCTHLINGAQTMHDFAILNINL